MTLRPVGILTFHRCINYGSYWQARCLVEAVRATGREAVLLDHRSVEVERAELRCAFRPTLPSPAWASDFAAYGRKVRAFGEAVERLPLSPPFPLDRPEEMAACDTVIVGSDEVWNLDHPWYGGAPLFFGVGIDAPVMSYAASCGHQPAMRPVPEHLAQGLDRFQRLCVRDENSRDIVRAATGREPEIALDPCLLFPPDPPGVDGEDGRPYIAVYGHNFPHWLVERARRDGRRLVSIGYRNEWADVQRLDVGPLAFADLIAGATAVVSNFFHGCVFALLYGKPLVTVPSAYRANKIESLMRGLGAEAAIMKADSDVDSFARILREPVDLAGRLDALRQQSSAYLYQLVDSELEAME